MIVQSQKQSEISQEGLLKPENKQFPFDTEMSQDPQIEDKQFSPWVRKKTNRNSQLQNKNSDYHQFLAKINITPKLKKNEQLESKLRNFSGDAAIHEIRASLESKLKAQKMHTQDYIEIIKNNRKTIESRGFFQRRAGFSKAYKKPRSIDLCLNCDSKKFLKCSPYAVNQKAGSPDPQMRRKQKYLVKKLKNKKESKEGKQFLETINNFKQSSMFVDTKKMFYKTLELKVSPFSTPVNREKYKKNQSKSNSISKVMNLSARVKFPLKNEREQHENDEEKVISCEGKHLFTAAHKSRGQKIRHRNLLTRDVDDAIFFK